MDVANCKCVESQQKHIRSVHITNGLCEAVKQDIGCPCRNNSQCAQFNALTPTNTPKTRFWMFEGCTAVEPLSPSSQIFVMNLFVVFHPIRFSFDRGHHQPKHQTLNHLKPGHNIPCTDGVFVTQPKSTVQYVCSNETQNNNMFGISIERAWSFL